MDTRRVTRRDLERRRHRGSRRSALWSLVLVGCAVIVVLAVLFAVRGCG